MTRCFDLAALAPQKVELQSLEPFWPATPERPLEELRLSIESLGLLKPLVLIERAGSLKILSGSRRRAVLLSLGQSRAPAVILPPDTSQERSLALALADNLERGWNEAEQALYWSFLESIDAEMAGRLAPFLALPPSPKFKLWCSRAASLPAEGLRALAEGRLDLETGARLSCWSAGDLAAVLPLFEALSPSKQKKREWLNWLEDISRREHMTAAAVLADPEITGLLAEADKHGRPAAETALRRRLWSRRHPLLAQLSVRRETRLRALNLPAAARLELDPSLEDVSFNLRLSFATLDEFRGLAETLNGLAESSDLAALLDDSGDENHGF